MTQKATATPDTRTALLEAALLCFGRHGYDGTSIRMVAELAGRPLSLISHHFGGKDGLYFETFKYIFQRPNLQRLLPGTSEPHPRNRIEAIRQFRETIHLMYTVASEPYYHPEPLDDAGRQLWLREMQSPREDILVLIKEFMTPWKDRIRSCIQILRPDLQDTETDFLGAAILGQSLVHGLTRVLCDAVWGINQLSQFKSAELITEFALNGLGVPPSA